MGQLGCISYKLLVLHVSAAFNAHPKLPLKTMLNYALETCPVCSVSIYTVVGLHSLIATY